MAARAHWFEADDQAGRSVEAAAPETQETGKE
jgi:hypothetical protein